MRTIPISVYQDRGQAGGLATAHISREQRKKDLAEARDYMAAHPDAKAYDVALELHYTDNAARRIMKAARKAWG